MENEKEQQREKVDKVIKGTAKIKQNKMHKFADVFIAEDAKNVKSYILTDVLIPTIKNAIVDVVTNGVNMIFFGGTRPRDRGSNASKISYSSYYDQRRYPDRRPIEISKPRYNYDEIVLESRGEAEEVLTRMCELIDTYQMVKVADLYDLVGISCDYTANNYGWTNLRNASIERVRDGYILKLPKALPID